MPNMKDLTVRLPFLLAITASRASAAPTDFHVTLPYPFGSTARQNFSSEASASLVPICGVPSVTNLTLTKDSPNMVRDGNLHKVFAKDTSLQFREWNAIGLMWPKFDDDLYDHNSAVAALSNNGWKTGEGFSAISQEVGGPAHPEQQIQPQKTYYLSFKYKRILYQEEDVRCAFAYMLRPPIPSQIETPTFILDNPDDHPNWRLAEATIKTCFRAPDVTARLIIGFTCEVPQGGPPPGVNINELRARVYVDDIALHCLDC